MSRSSLSCFRLVQQQQQQQQLGVCLFTATAHAWRVSLEKRAAAGTFHGFFGMGHDAAGEELKAW